MNLIRTCVERPVSVSVGVILILLFGLLALFAIPVQLTPNVDITVIQVTTSWPGATPLEIEQEVIERQEEMLQSVQGLRKMTSQSSDNVGQITLEFRQSVSKDTALRDVADKLRQVSNYPLEVDEPTIQATDAAIESPIAWLILYSDDPEQSVNTPLLQDFADDYIKPYFDRVEGVANVQIFGGREREMQVVVDPGELAARRLSMGQVVSALRAENENISAGARPQGKRDFSVRTVGQYDSADEILNTVVEYTDGGPVYVRDVAEVQLGYAREGGFVRSKGQYVLAFPVRREVGTNVIQVMTDLRKAIKRVNKEVLEARNMGLEIRQVYDETEYITDSMAMVQSNIMYGGIFAVIILMLFLRNWRATLIVAVAIPIAVIGTFVIIVGLGRTLNVISLAGIAFAVGMVVDNAIVVLENIFRHREMGKPAMQAAIDGVSEVWGAVLAGTLTTMAVFIPVIFVEQEAGQLFRDISIATATAVGLSLIISTTVIPTLASRLFRKVRPGGAAGGQSGEPAPGLLARFFASLVGWINRSVAARLAVIAIMLGGALLLAATLAPSTTYLPQGNRNLVFGFLITPPGYSTDEFRQMAATIERMVKPYWEAEPGSPEKAELDRKWNDLVDQQAAQGRIPELAEGNTGMSWLERDRARREWYTPPPVIENFFFVTFGSNCFMGASSADPARVKPLQRLLTVAGQQIPGVYAIFNQASLFSFGGGNNAEIQIRGDDLDKVVSAAGAMFRPLMQEYGQPRPSPGNFNLGRPELRVRANRERAADLGLSVTDIGLIVEAAVDGSYVGEFREAGGRKIDIEIYVAGQRDRPVSDIGDIPVYSPLARASMASATDGVDNMGGIVPLAAAVDMVKTAALEQINHTERQRSVTLTVTPPESLALEAVINNIQNKLVPTLRAQGAIDPSVLVSLTGNADKLTEARQEMIGEWKGFNMKTLASLAGGRFFLSVLIVYLLMASLYESWLYPFVIMFSVPLALFGGVFGLWVCQVGTLMTTNQPVQQLDVLTFLGFVILVGIVVNNAILLVSQTLINMREHGMQPQEAVRNAVLVRVRPVFMTSLTTFFGQLPLALFPGAGSELYRGLAAVMLGGLLIATLGTLILVPAVLSLVAGVRENLRMTGGAPTPALNRDR